jgi:hypothetical protein
VRRVVEGHDGLGRPLVGDEDRDEPPAQGAEDRADLGRAARHADPDGDPAELAGVEGDRPVAERGADEPPVEIERADEDLPDRPGPVELAGQLRAEHRLAPDRGPDPERGDLEPVPEIEDPPDAGVGAQRGLGRRVVDEARREEAERHAADPVGHPTERLAGGTAEPVPAAQRHDRGPRLVQGLVGGEDIGHRRDRETLADADDRSVTDRRPKDVGRQPADHPPADLLGPDESRRQVNRGEPEPGREHIRGRRVDRRLVHDPDLDDPLGPGALQQSRDLRPGDAEELGDARLCLTELVVEAARLDQLLDVGHAGSR